MADLEERGFSPIDYKIWVLQGHFQGDRNFTFEGLDAAKNRHLNWRNRIATELQKPQKTDCKIIEKLLEALDNNLNSAEAFAIIDNTAEISLDDWKKIDELFGLKLIDDTKDISDADKALILEREKAREKKDWAKSDDIRHELEIKGITVKDTPDGSVWQYLK